MWRKVCQRGRGSWRKHVGGSGVLDVQSVLTVRRFHRVIRRSAAQASTSAIANPDPTGRGCGARPGETSQPFRCRRCTRPRVRRLLLTAAPDDGHQRAEGLRRRHQLRPDRDARAVPLALHVANTPVVCAPAEAAPQACSQRQELVLLRGAPELAGGDVGRVAHQPVDPYLVGNQVAAVPAAAVLEHVVREGHRVGVGEVPG